MLEFAVTLRKLDFSSQHSLSGMSYLLFKKFSLFSPIHEASLYLSEKMTEDNFLKRNVVKIQVDDLRLFLQRKVEGV